VKSVELVQTFLMDKRKDLSVELLYSLMILWYFYSMIGLQDSYFFTLFQMLIVFLNQSLIKSLHFHISLNLILSFDGMMCDWWGSIIRDFML